MRMNIEYAEAQCNSISILLISFQYFNKTNLKYTIRNMMTIDYTKHFIKTQAWEPSSAKVTESYSRHLPALERFYRETNFSL